MTRRRSPPAPPETRSRDNLGWVGLGSLRQAILLLSGPRSHFEKAKTNLYTLSGRRSHSFQNSIHTIAWRYNAIAIIAHRAGLELGESLHNEVVSPKSDCTPIAAEEALHGSHRRRLDVCHIFLEHSGCIDEHDHCRKELHTRRCRRSIVWQSPVQACMYVTSFPITGWLHCRA